MTTALIPRRTPIARILAVLAGTMLLAACSDDQPATNIQQEAAPGAAASPTPQSLPSPTASPSPENPGFVVPAPAPSTLRTPAPTAAEAANQQDAHR